MSNNSYVSVPVEITLNGQLADLTGSNVPFEYYGPEVLSVRWIYPIAGHKKGGTTVTVYGTGFKTLGQDIVSNVFDRKTGKSHGARGVKCIFGDLPMVEGTILYPIGDGRARAALGDDPDLDTDDEPLASAIECVAPPWSNISTYYLPPEENGIDRCSAEDARSTNFDTPTGNLPRELCEVDEPKRVCVRVTLNDDPHAHSGAGGEDCVRYVYFDE